MTRTPDECKKGLVAPVPVHFHRGDPEPHLTPLSLRDLEVLHTNALALIQQLQAENAEKAETIERLNTGVHKLIVKIQQLEAERDAAVACIPRVCKYCKHDGPLNAWGESECEFDSLFPNGCLNGNTRWEWRGVQKEE